ncbi:hypothetical protein CCP3SC5AM1_1090004 [Gammaproteobacteria bacterium]
MNNNYTSFIFYTCFYHISISQSYFFEKLRIPFRDLIQVSLFYCPHRLCP